MLLRAGATVLLCAAVACRAAAPPHRKAATLNRRATLGAGLAAALLPPRPAFADPPKISDRVAVPGRAPAGDPPKFVSKVAETVTVPGTVSPFAAARSDGAGGPGGPTIIDGTVGDGAPVAWGQVLKIRYVGYTRPASGEMRKFDDQKAYLVRHGNNRIVRGLDEGLHTMRVGGTRRIEVPLNLGYVTPGLGPLPSSARARGGLDVALGELEAAGVGDVVFDVTLLDAWEDEADQGYYRDSSFSDEELRDIKARADAIGKGLK